MRRRHPPSHLKRKTTKQMQRIRMLRLPLKRKQIALLGLGQSPGLVMRDGGSNQIGDAQLIGGTARPAFSLGRSAALGIVHQPFLDPRPPHPTARTIRPAAKHFVPK